MKGKLKVENSGSGKVNLLTVKDEVTCEECDKAIRNGKTCFLCMKTKKFFHVQCIQENHVPEHVQSGDMNETKDLLVKLKIEPISAQNTENSE